MNGLNINKGHFKDSDISLIQEYWDLLLDEGYEIENDNVLVLNLGSINEKIFIVNSDLGYIKHIFREIVIDKEVNLYVKSMASILRNFKTATDLKNYISDGIDNRRLDLIDEIKFFNLATLMLNVLETKGYQIIPYVGYQIIKITEAVKEEDKIEYKYKFDYNLRKITLEEITPTTMCSSILYYDDFINLNVQNIFSALYKKLPTKR